ncbi:BTAD domain-containing putative transcriptional regulator [Phycicoccus jejuensis]|uniref:BTAD domain-containing putative transcriptional regulator n=1 Tax=Phycicoccus jejuensis TaxID=367299 RepID=UPI0004C2B91A|nr:BTAD domain-containing putative transcriptional regulator [Phycicoccus jejuensis]
MRVRVLGSTAVDAGDGPVVLAARRPRSILAALALSPGATTSADRLVDLVWGGRAPAGALGTLHSYISGLRRVLEPDLAPRARPTVLVTSDAGYRLALDSDRVDAVVFAREVRARHAALAPLWSQLTTGPDDGWPTRDEVGEHVEALEAALRTWTGTAYADLGDHPDVLADRGALDELRATAEEDTALGLLALGEHAAVLAAAEQAVSRHPLRERSHCLRALALVRTGRQAEGLEALRGYRRRLAEDLGLDPGTEVRALEAAVLRQDPALGRWLAPAAGPAPDRPAARERAATDAPGPAPAVALAGWPLVGRERERAALVDLLSAAAAGSPGHLLVVGDPGAGKTRLVDDVVDQAHDRGMVSAVGRCSQDDGAPPFWPWFALLEGLGIDPPEDLVDTGGDDGDGAARAFAVQDALAQAVRRRSRDDPVLLVVEDLHWADTRTLRALAHLVTSLRPGDHVALVLTRRSRPAPVGALADLGAALARHGGRTLEPVGLAPAQARELVAAVSGADRAPSAVEVDDWCARTGGNPFFLVELARLAAAPGGWRGEVPESVQVVVARRLADLPEDTREVLLVSAALGRAHSPLLLAHVGGWDPARVAELLEPAEEAGIVHHRDDGSLAFEHALTRDAVLATATTAGVARTHARIAHALASVADAAVPAAQRDFDLAHHWLAAGPVHAPRAWRAAEGAAQRARRLFANVEATDLYRSALDAHALDPAGTREERYDLLLAYSEAAAHSGRWRRVVEAVVEAVALARAAEDPERVARAASELTRYSVWTPQEMGEVDEDLLDDLRAALAASGEQDSPARCVLMLALAVQLYYRWGSEPEVDALVDEGTAMARRLGDRPLLAWAAHAGWIALWRPTELARRTRLADEELAAAAGGEDAAAEALAHLTRAGTAIEHGDLDGWVAGSKAADRIARRRRLAYVEYVLHFVRFSLATLRDEDAAADAHAAAMRSMQDGLATPALEQNEFGILYSTATWRPGVADQLVDPLYAEFVAEPFDLGRWAMLHLLALVDREDALRSELERVPMPPFRNRWWHTAEAAAHVLVAARLRDPRLAREAVDALRPSEGTMALTGISLVNGPVDGYLALGLAVLGETEEAARLADRAELMADRWGMSAYTRMLTGERARLGF